MEEEWRQLLSEVLNETAESTADVVYILERLRQKTAYGQIHSLWVCGTPRKHVKQLLRVLLWEIGARKEP
jgi:hypothetical protein